jgi:hypothetical protein
MMETISTSETSVNLYQTTLRNILEDSHFHTRRRENLKSQIFTVSKGMQTEVMELIVEGVRILCHVKSAPRVVSLFVIEPVL